MKSQWHQLTVRFNYTILVPKPPPSAIVCIHIQIHIVCSPTPACARVQHTDSCAIIYELIDQNKYRWPAFFKNYVKSKVKRKTNRDGQRTEKERDQRWAQSEYVNVYFKPETTNHKKLTRQYNFGFHIYYFSSRWRRRAITVIATIKFNRYRETYIEWRILNAIEWEKYIESVQHVCGVAFRFIHLGAILSAPHVHTPHSVLQ